MRRRTRVLAVLGSGLGTGLAVVAPAHAQTAGLESPSLWLLIASLAQIVGAAAVMVFFITRRRPRHCPRCGQRLDRDACGCARYGGGRRPPAAGG